MQQQIAVVGGDARQCYLAQALEQSGFSVSCFEVPNLENTHSALQDALAHADVLALPMPALKTPERIISTYSDGIELKAVLDALARECMIFGGALQKAKPILKQYPQQVHEYLDDEALTISNAVPTAEGAIRIAMTQMRKTLWQSNCLVIGFGRIGKALATRLQALGADVTVTARKPADFALASSMGLCHDRTGMYLRGLDYDCIFNTVCAPILSAEQFGCIRCPIIELASSPGGLAADAPQPPNYIKAPGLPGRFTPQTAGYLLHDMIIRTLRVKEAVCKQ